MLKPLLSEPMALQTDRLKILLIDDTRLVLDHLTILLSSLADVEDTRAVERAEEGLGLLESFHPDIIVLDINMPGMNGIEMLREMHSRKIAKPVIIMLTNNTLAGYRDECIRLGADYFLDKSRDFQRIPEIIMNIRLRVGN